MLRQQMLQQEATIFNTFFIAILPGLFWTFLENRFFRVFAIFLQKIKKNYAHKFEKSTSFLKIYGKEE
jgi:hypothetical protein